MTRKSNLGGVVHVYQKYDPGKFPSPTQPPPDLVSPAFEHALMYGNYRELTEEELARAVQLDPSQLAGLGPSIDYLRQLLEERRRKLLEKYQTRSVVKSARQQFLESAMQAEAPKPLRKMYRQAVEMQQLYLLERIYYRVGDDTDWFSRQLVQVIDRLSDKYQVDELAAKYEFTGLEKLSIPRALEVKEELEAIDELLRQLDEAEKTAQIGVIDLEQLGQFAQAEDLAGLQDLQQQVQDLVRELAERQGLDRGAGQGGYQLTPQAYRIFQGKLLERIFSNLEAGRSGRHQANIVGQGSVALSQTKQYEFGDSLADIDIGQTVLNSLIRDPRQQPVRINTGDIEVHKTRNSPKCATVVIMDMSGSMRYDGQYMNVKRMALALQGLISSEYPGDFLRFIEMYSFGRMVPPAEIIELMPKPVTIHDPWVRLRADMSRDDISESQVPPHFTNIQHALQLARRNLAASDAANKQVFLITDGLPTAHFEDSELFLLYPPDPRTEQATLTEGKRCAQEGITINMFLVPSWSQSEEDVRFAQRLAQSTRGRVIFTAGGDLDRFVIWDYIEQKREILG